MLRVMGKSGMLFWCFLLALQSLFLLTTAAQQPNCSYPAVYAFGDSLSDTGNSISAFPDKFALSEQSPNGEEFPMHAADRYCDGKLVVDYLAFGVRRRPIYPVLRGTAGNFTYGTNFAAFGAPARKVKVWINDEKFNVPFYLDIQQQWYERYKTRVWFYESPYKAGLTQALPTLASVADSLFVVWAGYQDYFFSLYDKALSPSKTKKIVPDVVAAIEEFLVKMLTPVAYIPPGYPSQIMPTASTIFVVNMPPLGCIPALLTLYGGPNEDYDDYGCLEKLNKITHSHNTLLGEKVAALRTKHPNATLVYADAESVYYDILKSPVTYNVTSPLTACCGVGGNYNFNPSVTCGNTGTVDGNFVNLTLTPCADPKGHLSWDGIHTSNTFNKAAVTAWLTGKHVTPAGGLNCSPEFANWDTRE